MSNTLLRSLLIATVGIGGAAMVLAEEGPEDLEIYLLIGQSNMAGRAPITAREEGPLKGCFLLNGEDEFEPATHPLNQYSTIRKGLGMQKLNPGYAFAKTMLAAAGEGKRLGLVVNAKGGTKIEQWEKGTEFFDEAVRRAKIARKSGTLKGILWHQGEGNRKGAETYLRKLAGFVADLRAALGEPELPFVAGQIMGEELINEEIAKLPAEVPHTGVAESKGLEAMDRSHFDNKSMLELGERYAKAMLAVQGAEK